MEDRSFNFVYTHIHTCMTTRFHLDAFVFYNSIQNEPKAYSERPWAAIIRCLCLKFIVYVARSIKYKSDLCLFGVYLTSEC